MDIVLSEVRNGLLRVAIAYTGQKFKQGDREFTISAQDLDQMRANLSTREVPIDYEHLSARDNIAPGWTKAAGWMKPDESTVEKLSDGRSVLWGWFEPTPACLASIQQKEFRYFSPEIHWNSKDETGKAIGTQLKAGAITNRPFLKDLPPIEIAATDYPQLLEAVALSESKRLVDTNAVNVDKEIQTMKTFKFKKLTAGEHKGKVGVFDEAEMVGLCDKAQMKSYLTEDDPDEPDADDAKKKALREADASDALCLTEIQKAEPSKMITMAETFVEDEKLSMKGFIRVQKIDRLLTEAQSKGKFLPASRVKWFAAAVADFANTAALLSEMKPVVDLRTHGIQGDGQELDEAKAQNDEVTAYMTEKKVDRITAFREVTRQHPERYERVKNQQPVVASRD